MELRVIQVRRGRATLRSTERDLQVSTRMIVRAPNLLDRLPA